MIKLICEENNIEYAGSGYLQCGRHVDCPKKKNNKVLGFDCLIYIDNLPEGCQLDISRGYEEGKIKVSVIKDVTEPSISADTNMVETTVKQKSDKYSGQEVTDLGQETVDVEQEIVDVEQEIVDLSPVLDVRSMIQKYNRAANGGA